MSGGGYRGGSSIVGPKGWSTYDDAENRSVVKSRKIVKKKSQIFTTKEADIVDYLIQQKLNGSLKIKLNRNIDPKLKLKIKKFTDPYEWAKKQSIFKERFLVIRNAHDKKKKPFPEKENIDEKLLLKNKVSELEILRAKYEDKIAEINKNISEIKIKIT
tara:strand:+ start:527 stop:1003 length:477 start_codon:yes stop_codon:yes gene_type:complete